MKCSIPEISWHNREPVLSVDIHPISTEFYRLATSGGDCHVLIWQMIVNESGGVQVEVISDLTRHQRAVNCVRWSPSGQYLASADDDANIIVWQQKTDNIPSLDGDTNDREVWIVYKVLRGHQEDIYDVCWSPDGSKLFSGSVDNTAILWDLHKGKIEHILTDHKGFVQGVAWDPKNQLIASISTDRVCRLFDCSGKQIKARISKGLLPVNSDHFLYEKEVKFFYDDTYKSFFRRLQFSPDGSLLIVPSGHVVVDDSKKVLNGTLVFTLDNMAGPAAIMPLKRQCSTVVRCSPVLYELRNEGPSPTITLPYRMIVAIGTDHDVILYDTQQSVPFARFHDIHYTRLTDLTWSNDGLLLVASSTDGFCALITFDSEELGVPYVQEEEIAASVLDVSGCEELEKDENVDISNKKEEKPKKPSYIEKWAIKTPKKPKEDHKESKNHPDNDVAIPKDVPEVKEDINKLEVRKKPRTEEMEDKSIPKLIEVRKKPRLEQKENDKDLSVAPPTEVRKKPATEKIEDISVAIPTKDLKNPRTECKEIKPIEKMETEEDLKPKVNKGSINILIPKRKIKQRVTNPSCAESSAAEEVSQKSVVQNIDSKPNKNSINVLIPKRIVPTKVEENNKLVKPIEINNKTTSEPDLCTKDDVIGSGEISSSNKTDLFSKRRLVVRIEPIQIREENFSTLQKDSEIDTDTEKVRAPENIPDNVEKTEKTKETKSSKNKTTTPMFKIKLKDTSNTQKEKTPKKTVTTNLSEEKKKVKTPTSSKATKRKLSNIATPPAKKSNPLLDFLKRSAEKSRQKALLESKPVLVESDKISSTKTGMLEFKEEPVTVDLTLDENSSTETWMCETIKDSERKLVSTDDNSEDFSLQLEDSEPEATKDKKSDAVAENQENSTKKAVCEDISGSVKVTNFLKPPRRVALITLSSPKKK